MPDVIYMRKKELLTKINKNLSLHRKIYKDAMDAFKVNYSKRLGIMLETVKKENKFLMELELTLPENHEDDYIRAINMVKLNCRNEIALREDEFNEYILNKWHWIETFKHSYVLNCSSSASSSSSGSSSKSKKEVETYFSGVE
jgi:hypothetical protein